MVIIIWNQANRRRNVSVIIVQNISRTFTTFVIVQNPNQNGLTINYLIYKYKTGYLKITLEYYMVRTSE